MDWADRAVFVALVRRLPRALRPRPVKGYTQSLYQARRGHRADVVARAHQLGLI
jgi:hypothetical protein